MTIIDPLQPAPKSRAPEIRNAYRFLKVAHDSVAALFDVSQTLSRARRASNAGRKGRMNTQEIDLLRAAIVFTASGPDASMTRLVNDAGRYLLTRPESAARAQYEEFLKAEMSKPQVSSGMKSAITSADNDSGKTKRTHRSADSVAYLCNDTFLLCSEFIDATADELKSSR